MPTWLFASGTISVPGFEIYMAIADDHPDIRWIRICEGIPLQQYLDHCLQEYLSR